MVPTHPLTFEEYCSAMDLYSLSDAEIEAKYKEAVSVLYWARAYRKVTLGEIDDAIRGKNCSDPRAGRILGASE